MGELNRNKNTATRVYFPLIDTDGALVAGATGLDSEIDLWSDGADPDGFVDCNQEATHVGGGWYELQLTAGETNDDYIAIQVKSNEALTQCLLINTTIYEAIEANEAKIDDIITDVQTNETKIDTIDTNVDSILVDTGTTIPGTLTTIDNEIAVIDGNVDSILTDTGTTLDTAITTIDTIVDAIKAKTDNLPADPASETNVDANETKIDTVDTVVDAIKAVTDNLPDSGALTTIDTNLKQAVGLVNRHIYIDTTVFDGDGNMTSARVRIYDSAANATTHGAGGLLYTLTVTATYSGGNLSTYLATLA